MNLVLMGPPGAGKGTQGEILSKRLDINTISTGVMLRTAIKEQSEIGKIAEKYINDGKLVPDDVIVSIVKERLQKPDCAKGFILDGFPRTTAQAEALTEALDKIGEKLDYAIDVEVPDDNIINRMSGRRACVADEAIIERLSSRRECSKCGAPYNIISNKPETEGICDKCKGELIQRADDVPETIKNRLNVYHEQTEPIKAYYEKLGLLVTAKGEDKLEDTTSNVAKALGLEV